MHHSQVSLAKWNNVRAALDIGAQAYGGWSTCHAVQWERNALAPDVRDALLGMGHAFAPQPRGIGRCQAIEIHADGTRTAVADPRSGGTAAAY